MNCQEHGLPMPHAGCQETLSEIQQFWDGLDAAMAAKAKRRRRESLLLSILLLAGGLAFQSAVLFQHPSLAPLVIGAAWIAISVANLTMLFLRRRQ